MLVPLPRSQFCEQFIVLNGELLNNFDKFVFRPGMLYGSLEKWWAPGDERPQPHEGLDLCEYRDTDGMVHELTPDVRVPAAYDGQVVKIIDDFLGKSIFVRHRIFSKEGAFDFCSVYGHTRPVADLHEGCEVTPAAPIATLSEPSGNKSKIPPHLHLTLLWMPRTLPDHQLTWQAVPSMTLVDPLKLFPDKYRALK